MNPQKLKLKRAERRRFRVRKAIYGTPAEAAAERVPEQPAHLRPAHRRPQRRHARRRDERRQEVRPQARRQRRRRQGGRQEARRGRQGQGDHRAAFDRGAYRFHGRIEALAVAATEAGLVCTSLESLKAKQRQGRGEARGQAQGEEGRRASPRAKESRRARSQKANRRAKASPKVREASQETGEGKPKGEEKS